MAKRRCINIDFYDSEEFCEMPARAKHLYTELILHSDDEGVVINPKAVLRVCKTEKRLLDFLVEKNFLLQIDGIYIIRHWYVHNTIQPTRKVDSIYSRVLSKLYVNQSKVYCINDDILSTNCQPNITKLNINKDNLSEINSNQSNLTEVNEIELNSMQDAHNEEDEWSIAPPRADCDRDEFNRFLDKLCNGYDYKSK